MVKKYLIIATILIIFIGGCSQIKPENNYEKIEKIVLERSEMFTLSEYAIQNITITKDGILYETFYPNGTKYVETYTKFESNEFNSLIEVLKTNNGLLLNEKYVSEILVADVGKGIIYISGEGIDKQVEINPYIQDGNPNEVKNIMDEIDKLISNAKSPFFITVTMKYQGKQCIDEPWDIWYKEGNINFIKEPTTSELISAYYSSKGIEIMNLKEFDNGIVCQACEVCPDQYSYEVDVYKNIASQLLNEGWIEK